MEHKYDTQTMKLNLNVEAQSILNSQAGAPLFFVGCWF